MPNNKRIAVLGTVGVPGNYGGFETLAENLVRYHAAEHMPADLLVYCSSKSYAEKSERFLSAELVYIPLQANGAQSIAYDMLSLLHSVWRKHDMILLLGVSGAMLLPLIRLISSARIVTNIDGIEWKRQKWKGLAKWILRFSERMAVRYSHEVIADNQAIADYVCHTYGIAAHVIAYGGDHALAVAAGSVDELHLPDHYAFSVCRIEPENNVGMILQAFAGQVALPLVMVGNWKSSAYGRELQADYGQVKHLHLLDPIYDLGKLNTLRAKAAVYVHGHSAGGTNPSLVEAMHFGKPILAFDCSFNRYTTEDKAMYFSSAKDLFVVLDASASSGNNEKIGLAMLDIARRRYTWNEVGRAYFALLQ